MFLELVFAAILTSYFGGEALDILHVSKEGQENVFAMLATVLWLGNVTFSVIDNQNHVEPVIDEGVVDIIFGHARSVFHECEICVIADQRVEIKGSVTAHNRTYINKNTGFVFTNGRVYGIGHAYLGRPTAEWHHAYNSPKLHMSIANYEDVDIGALGQIGITFSSSHGNSSYARIMARGLYALFCSSDPILEQKWVEVTVDTQGYVLIDAVNHTKLLSSKIGVSRTIVFANKVDAIEAIAMVLQGAEKGDIFVCTDAASRGTDIPNVSHVIQAEFATSAVDFLHRGECTVITVSCFQPQLEVTVLAKGTP
ncbi:DEA(D/H)-box RNA helicase family protein [Artemisia annua]|uniref:pectinesterase n=1 Tax=Artemisia annua TaxID=35608 RepID=A0A2U1NNG2_ARTAN|nr:DEA(D/H)-box RNA helicase family protein [Artemisia annua]